MRFAPLVVFLLYAVTYSAFANKACSEKEYRQFDFWLGQWQVTTKSDDVIRNSSITLINDGCTLLEEYSTPGGFVGKSLNIYDHQQKQWHQTWTDNAGQLLLLNGQATANTMVLSGLTRDENNITVLNRITWTANEDGTVRQHWQTSKNGGQTWNTSFDGLYTKID